MKKLILILLTAASSVVCDAAVIVQSVTASNLTATGVYSSSGSGGSTNSSLVTNLVAHWRFDEASGNRLPTVGTNVFATGTLPGSAPGMLTNAALFTAASSEYMATDDGPALSMGDIDFTIACWVKFTTATPAYQVVFDKDVNTTYSFEYGLWLSAAQKLAFYIGNNSGWTNVTWGSTASAGTWYFVVLWHDATANTLNISVNNGTPVASAWSGGSYDNAAKLSIGKANSQTSMRFDGTMDSLSVWKRVLTAGERTALYNSGTGKDYPFE